MSDYADQRAEIERQEWLAEKRLRDMPQRDKELIAILNDWARDWLISGHQYTGMVAIAQEVAKRLEELSSAAQEKPKN